VLLGGEPELLPPPQLIKQTRSKAKVTNKTSDRRFIGLLQQKAIEGMLCPA